ncbi:PhzF family phenazine biosynthesis protein [Burkholderia glumae]|uniref:PhzF family phenazine biosynthesis protein n=1 Tax=Burkholderia glumae TaxID=337 RepID=UPI00214F93AF|nr:PhzF family phenazine biosynthesis protein [Burkholderia glumae]
MNRHVAGVQAFTVNGERGNAAFVFATQAHERVDIDACIALSAQLQSEVAWLRRDAGVPGLGLRFFTPGGEIAFCGHGVLASAAWLDAFDGEQASHVFEVSGALVSVERDSAGRWFYLQEEGGSEPVDLWLLDDALRALGLTHTDALRTGGAKLARTVGAPREKLLLELPDPLLLGRIELDPARRDALCERLGTTGIYAFAVKDREQPRLAARHFAIRVGTQEDMATGSVAPTVVRHAGLSGESGDVVIDQGGPGCNNARLFVSAAMFGTARRVAGECVIGPQAPLVGIVSTAP